jgi:hypothetical protein
MNTPWYDYLPDSSGDIFYFASSGDAKIDKVVVFTQMDDPDTYGVALGNLRSDGSIDVDGQGDRGDTVAVLSMVAKAIAFFLTDHPEAGIVIEGTTSARARLYQMAIVRELDDLGKYFDVYGFDGRNKEIFQHGSKYLSFTITLKNS